MRIDDIDLVHQLPLFARMEASNFDALMQAAYLQQFPPHLQLIAEGDPADFLYVLVEGKVELFARTGSRETTMFVALPVSSFILAAVLKDAVYLMSARTIEKSRLLLIPSSDIRAAFENDSSFARSILLDLATSYRGVVKALKGQKLRSSLERLANYLVRQCEEQGARDRVDLPIDKKTLASLLGMTPENLSRAFNSLAAYGVSVEGPVITLAKTADLRRLAKPDVLIDDPAS
jgi:CRP/FNR family transcriptional activator FtrB